MADKTLQIEPVVDPTLAKYIDKQVATKVAEHFDILKSQLENVCSKNQSKTTQTTNRATIVVFSGEMDKQIAALIIASGAAAMGMEVSMYFTFWGLSTLKKKTLLKGKTISEKLATVMMPCGPENLGTSKFNMFGIGSSFLKHLMKTKNIQTPAGLINLVRELGVRMVACQMSMDVMGLNEDELIDQIDYGGVATYLADAKDSKITLFI